MSHSRLRRSAPLAVAGLLATALLLTACSGDGTPDSGPTPTPSPTKASVAPDLTVLQVARTDFCDRVDLLVVAEALPLDTTASPSPTPSSATPASVSGTGSATASGTATPSAGTSATTPALVAWTNGDMVNGQQGQDVAHEYGCRWTLPGSKATAAAWVFAPPVTTKRARALAKQMGTGCQAPTTEPAFGTVSVATSCPPTANTKVATTRWAGLFGDAWLVCETTGPDAAARASAFCPAVVTRIAEAVPTKAPSTQPAG